LREQDVTQRPILESRRLISKLKCWFRAPSDISRILKRRCDLGHIVNIIEGWTKFWECQSLPLSFFSSSAVPHNSSRLTNGCQPKYVVG
jgi:hypothetical protein